MDTDDKNLKISSTEECTFGCFDLAESLLRVKYSNSTFNSSKVNEIDKKKREKEKKKNWEEENKV